MHNICLKEHVDNHIDLKPFPHFKQMQCIPHSLHTTYFELVACIFHEDFAYYNETTNDQVELTKKHCSCHPPTKSDQVRGALVLLWFATEILLTRENSALKPLWLQRTQGCHKSPFFQDTNLHPCPRGEGW
ncbi:hypothetical protein ILYODFUR_034846 [Ilyodon furcidens]|uniref:Uncharacterized protein n=1 Tax=Ilyodon furcidens TaxID=33524 RepID=A0ABV0U1J1_9TELE